MNINNYNGSDGQNNGHSSTSCTTTAYENNQMSSAIEEHSMENQILLPEKVETFLEKNEHEIEQRHLENEVQISTTFYSSSFDDTTLNINTDLSSYKELGKTVDIYLSVLEHDLTTFRLSDKDKFWITESALRAIPFGNTDARKWSAEDVVLYLKKFCSISSPINYDSYYYTSKQSFDNFINKDINGEVFLTFNLTDLLTTIKPPRRRQVLMMYGAILILKKYISVYHTKFDETLESDECTGMDESYIDDDQIVPGDLCLNSEMYFPVLEAELGILKLSKNDSFWITESVVSALPMFGTIDVRKWTVREVIVYLKQLVKVSSPVNLHNNDPEKISTLFSKFTNEDINGVAFLMLTQRDLLNLIKPPGRRLVLMIYGAILILKKYSEIFHP